MVNVTERIRQAADGCKDAENEVLEFLYAELRSHAKGLLSNERPGHTLSSRDLLHAAYLRHFEGEPPDCESRIHFTRLIVRKMRQILVNHGKRRQVKLGYAEFLERELRKDERLAIRGDALEDEVGALDEVLQIFEQQGDVAKRRAEIISLRFFGGLTFQEIATHVGRSKDTVRNDLTIGLAVLFRLMTRDEPPEEN